MGPGDWAGYANLREVTRGLHGASVSVTFRLDFCKQRELLSDIVLSVRIVELSIIIRAHTFVLYVSIFSTSTLMVTPSPRNY